MLSVSTGTFYHAQGKGTHTHTYEYDNETWVILFTKMPEFLQAYQQYRDRANRLQGGAKSRLLPNNQRIVLNRVKVSQ